MHHLLQTLALLLLIGGSALISVKVQEGPICRTEGSELKLLCYVKDYQEPWSQHFQWSVYLSSSPAQRKQMISTLSDDFVDISYRDRVYSGEIYLEYFGREQIVLHIPNIQARDAGEYECEIPVPDGGSSGPYRAKTKVNVIPDTLQVVVAPEAFNKVAGDSLVLTCDVSSTTAQDPGLFNPTFTVSWLIRRQGEARPITLIELSESGIVSPAAQYRERFSVGGIRLDKVERTTYQLTMHHLQPSDQGEYFCEGGEWTLDRNDYYYRMTSKRSGGIPVSVHPAGR